MQEYFKIVQRYNSHPGNSAVVDITRMQMQTLLQHDLPSPIRSRVNEFLRKNFSEPESKTR